jgi:hypothetical protein
MTALVGFLKGVCHASFSTIRKFLRDVVGVTISRGQLAKLVQKVSASLKDTYENLLEALPGEARFDAWAGRYGSCPARESLMPRSPDDSQA